ncbi:MAG: PAS domain-containing sensor histidine kinase [Candidatus Latescibacterota bacterium]
MSEEQLPTGFAPAERAAPAEVQDEAHRLAAMAMLRQLVDAVPEVLLILNGNRQTVYANRRLLELMPERAGAEIFGARAGELPQGCGTGPGCRYCGLTRAILHSQPGEGDPGEWRLVQASGRGTNLRVQATPLEIEGRPYTLLCLSDASPQKRREVLERVLFEGILEDAWALRQMAEKLERAGLPELRRFRGRTHDFTEAVIREINEYRILVAAEIGQLNVHAQAVGTRDLLGRVVRAYATHRAALGKTVRLDRQARDVYFMTDPALLKQVLGYLILNALEASQTGDAVTVGCGQSGAHVEICVHNLACMSEEVQLQVFQRGFTTKGQGRGLGTYGVRLLVERFLKGRVSFSSSPSVGTTFRVSLPENL